MDITAANRIDGAPSAVLPLRSANNSGNTIQKIMLSMAIIMISERLHSIRHLATGKNRADVKTTAVITEMIYAAKMINSPSV